MKTTFIQCDQRSLDWFAARLGRLTGSRAEDAMKFLKSGLPAKARTDYRDELIAERITGQSDDEDPYISKAMQRGIDLEAAAFDAYEISTGLAVYRSGFLSCDEVMAGASLDGHISDGKSIEGIIEIKALNSRNHLNILREGAIPEDKLPQLTHNLWVSGAAWVDFVSFDDRFPKPAQLFVRRLHAKDVDLRAYELAALKFLAEVQLEHQAIVKAYGLQEAA